MSTYTIDVEEAQDDLQKLVAQALGGAEVVITQGHLPVAKLVPIPGKREFGSAKELIEMAENFDEPLEEFAEFTS
jgi:antitoxin (DNA-binding transcriptional repressor) of toxin-antitoxin stability system